MKKTSLFYFSFTLCQFCSDRSGAMMYDVEKRSAE